ncbi:MAG TPA: NADH-quinone oxidoreductase subunit J [Phototrophicaceae bacterium]|jgi:NADH-quinone oxidoreductase subunit J|nr:NADH-quinone oxidoreductase subunit J [Phototrophicaceae bacterium]
MGVEAILFVIVGVVAIVCAAMMLASENAVHSALFLIVNFMCVAFLYLMLEAPFLAMMQIAVYAGAIMVLFLFVIMLLGAEKLPTGEQVRRFPGLSVLGVVLAIAFLGITGYAIISGQVDLQAPAVGQAKLRVVNAAAVAAEFPDADQDPVYTTLAERDFDVYVDGELLASSVTPRDASEYITIAPGEHDVVFSPAGTAIEFVKTTVSLEAGQAVTAILTGVDDETLALDSFVDDLGSVDRRDGRVIVYNAYPEPVSVVDITSPLFVDSRKVAPIAMDIPVGESSTPLVIPESYVNWTVIKAGTQDDVQASMNPDDILTGLTDLRISRDTTQVLVVTPSRATDGTLSASVVSGDHLVVDAQASFGSPQSIGQLLFINYLLPFQLVAVLLLSAMVGVIVLTQQKEHVPKPSRALRRKVSRPLTSVIAAQTGSDLTAAPRLPEPDQADSAGD